MERSKERRRKTVVWASCSWTSSPVGTMLRADEDAGFLL